MSMGKSGPIPYQPSGQPPNQMGQAMGQVGAAALRPPGGMPPQAPPPGAPPPPPMTPPISPEGFNAYRALMANPIQGQKSKNAYNQAAMQFANQYGTGYDPSGALQRTKALRRRYGG